MRYRDNRGMVNALSWTMATEEIGPIDTTLMSVLNRMRMMVQLRWLLRVTGWAIRRATFQGGLCLLALCLATGISLDFIQENRQANVPDASNDVPRVVAPTFDRAESLGRDVPVRLDLPVSQQRWLSPTRSLGRPIRSTVHRSSPLKNSLREMSAPIEPPIHWERRLPGAMPSPAPALVLLC